MCRQMMVSGLLAACGGVAFGQVGFQPASELIPSLPPTSIVPMNAGQVILGMAQRYVYETGTGLDRRIKVAENFQAAVELALPPGGVSANLVGVSDDGLRILGRVGVQPDMARAALWQGDGGPQVVPLGVDASQQPSAMSGDGSRWAMQVGVGTGIRSFVTGVGGPTQIKVVPDEDQLATVATAMSPDGKTVAGVYNQTNGTMFVWNTTSGGEVITPPITTGQATPQFVANGGARMVSSRTFPTFSSPAQSYSKGRWRSITNMIPRCMSRDGGLVGGETLPSGSRAILWSETLGLEDPRLALIARGVDVRGWTLTSVNYISPDGRKLVGRGLAPGNQVVQRWWVASIEPYAAADIGRAGAVGGSDGRLDNNDLIVFIDRFFANDERGDVGRAGGERGGDGEFNNNDFVVFIDLFFSGNA